MDRPSTWLLDHRKNHHSQTGEDGVIGKILELLPETDRWCVEFGAFDGEHLSNTCHLIETREYSAVLIEADPEKFRRLEARFASNPRVHRVNRFVGFGASDGLEAILRKTPIPEGVDFLSIDIDGNDYHVWAAFSGYRPKIVCVEFNPTIPTELSFVQPPDPSLAQGCSLKALVDLGKSKGYELACVLPLNAIFVRDDLFPLLGIRDNSPHVLRTFNEAVTYVFQTYDGEVIVTGYRRFLWHYFPMRLKSVPFVFRGFPGNFGKVRKILWTLYGLVRARKAFREILARRSAGTWDGIPDALRSWKP